MKNVDVQKMGQCENVADQKRGIIMSRLYELLNDVSVNFEVYKEQELSELETKRIKKNVLNEIKARKKQNKTKWTTFAKACACVVLILGVGSAGIVAANGQLPEGIKNLFGIHSKKEIQIAGKMGKALDISAQDAGIKITAEGIMRDARHVGIVYKIEKSDGGMLDQKGRKCTGAEFVEDDCEGDGGKLWTSGSEDCLKQEWNRYHIRYYTIFNYDEQIGNNLQITISDLKLWFGDDPSEVDIKGNWTFDVAADCKDSSVDLAQGQKLQFGKEKATLKECSISSMGYYLEVTSQEKFNGNKIIKGVEENASLYLKNGDQIAFDGSSAPVLHKDGTWSFKIIGTFDAWIMPEDMDKVTIGDYEFKYESAKGDS